MEFVKIYSTRVPNAARTLDQKVDIASLLDRTKSDPVRLALASLLQYKSLNFWDFGVRATPLISVNSLARRLE